MDCISLTFVLLVHLSKYMALNVTNFFIALLLLTLNLPGQLESGKSYGYTEFIIEIFVIIVLMLLFLHSKLRYYWIEVITHSGSGKQIEF